MCGACGFSAVCLYLALKGKMLHCRGLQAVHQACSQLHAQRWLWRTDAVLPLDVDVQHPWVPGEILSLLCFACALCCDLGRGCLQCLCLRRAEQNRSGLSVDPRVGYGLLLLLHPSFWHCWRCTVSHIFLQGGTQLRPAALRSWLWAFRVRGEIIFSLSFLSPDFLPDHYIYCKALMPPLFFWLFCDAVLLVDCNNMVGN